MQLPAGTIRQLYVFGFNDGGSVAATYQLHAPYPYEPGRPILVGLCTDSQVSALLAGYGGSRHSLCGTTPPADAPCWQWTALYTYDSDGAFVGPTNWTTPVGVVPPTGTISFVAISCHHSADSISTLELDYACVNAGGEQLSAGEIPIKPITLAFTYIWAAFAAVLLAHAVYVRARWTGGWHSGQHASPVRSLHVALWLCVALSGASSFASWRAWLSLSSLGTYSLPLDLGVTVVSDSASAAVVMLVLALSRGWHITRPGLMKHEVSAVLCLTLLYAASWAVWEWIGGFFALFLLTLTYLLVLRYLFYSLTHSLRVLALFRAYAATLLHEAALREGTTLTRSSSSSVGRRGARVGAGQGPGAGAGSSSTTTPRGTSRAGAHGKAIGSKEEEMEGEEGMCKDPGSVEAASRPPPLASDARAVDERTAAMLALPAWGGLYDSPPGQGYGSTGSRSGDGESEEREDASLLGSREAQAGGGRGERWGWWSNITTRMTAALDYVTGITPGQREEAWGEGTEGEASPILRVGGLTSRQLALVRLLRSACVLYLSMDVFLNIWSELDLAVDPWVGVFMQNMCTLALLLLLAAVLRPRSTAGMSPLYDPSGYVSASEAVLEPLVGASILSRARGGSAPPAAVRTSSASNVKGADDGGHADAPTFVVLLGPEGQLAGAGADTDAVDLSLPRVPVPRPAGPGAGPLAPLSPSSRAGAQSGSFYWGPGDAGEDGPGGWQDIQVALRLSLADMNSGQGVPMGRYR